MINRHRGEIEARLDGEAYCLCLTLGALAELEDAFGEEDMVALAQRFETGRLKSTDAIRIIAAGLRGGGYDFCADDVAAMKAEGGVKGYVDIVARLLKATFASEQTPGGTLPGCGERNEDARRETEAAGSTGPFPGTT